MRPIFLQIFYAHPTMQADDVRVCLNILSRYPHALIFAFYDFIHIFRAFFAAVLKP